MMLRSTPVLLLVAALAGAGAACDVHVGENGVSLDVAHGKATEDWTRTYTLAKAASVEIINTNGTIEVESAPGDQLEVKATKTARAATDDEAHDLLKNVEVREEAASASEVRIKTAVTSGVTFGRRSANVEYHLKVPAGRKLTVRTENGGITLRDVAGNLTATTTNGGVRGYNLAGNVSAHTVNGGLVIDVAKVTGPIDMDVVNGGIRLDIPTDAKVDIDAHTVNGPTVVDRSLTLAGGEQGRGRVSGSLNGGGVKISVSTVNGGVRINARHGNAQPRDDGDEGPQVVVEGPKH